MTNSLYDKLGHRKYLVTRERRAFVRAALRRDVAEADFCLTLAVTGGRISEVLALTWDRVDFANEMIVFRTLKQRSKLVFRAIPVPIWLLRRLRQLKRSDTGRVWPWGRTTAWKIVKAAMLQGRITPPLCKPKALRHAFAIEAGQRQIPLNPHSPDEIVIARAQMSIQT